MIYLDYSATTPVSDEVLNSFNKACKYIGNPNSLHDLGLKASSLIDAATNQIKKILNTDSEVIYTSGASEANNTALLGVCLKYKNRGKHIITTSFEHSSIYGPLNYLIEEGFSVDYVKTDKYGVVDVNDLERLIRDDTILVSIGCVNSEIGIIQPIEKIGKLLKKYPKVCFHTDITQAVGKMRLNLDDVDLCSFSAHKIYGIKGIGCLLKKKELVINPLIRGGKSTTNYRSGTPPLELIVSLSKALRLIYEDFDAKYKSVLESNKYLKDNLSKYDKVFINSNEYSLPHMLNISVIGVKPEVLMHALEEDQIYISTRTACSVKSISDAVLALTNDKNRALSSVRISLSHLTTKKELDLFLKSFDDKYQRLTSIK